MHAILPFCLFTLDPGQVTRQQPPRAYALHCCSASLAAAVALGSDACTTVRAIIGWYRTTPMH